MQSQLILEIRWREREYKVGESARERHRRPLSKLISVARHGADERDELYYAAPQIFAPVETDSSA